MPDNVRLDMFRTGNGIDRTPTLSKDSLAHDPIWVPSCSLNAFGTASERMAEEKSAWK
jgi:hypothetical protein